MSLRFGTDGVRGVALTELTPSLVAALGRAAAEVLGQGRWLIGRDTRESGPTLEAAVAAGLTAAGAEPVTVGVVPTPALAWLSALLDVPAAMITASHNAWSDNGVKVFAAGGRKLADDIESAIESRLSNFGAAVSPDDTPAPTFEGVDDYVRHLVDGGTALGGLRVVLDCANGATSAGAPRVFRGLGADVTVINASPDGRNINDGCGATNPQVVAAVVVEAGADLGLAFDGDGDRVIAVDHLGHVVDGDRLLGLAALQLQEERALRDDTVVVTVMSNLGFHRAMRAAGINVVTTAVGDRYVLEALDEGHFSLGGEQSGHIIYRDIATTGDGILAGLRLAEFIHGHHRSLAELAGEVMTSFPQVLVNVRVADRHPAIADELAVEIAAAQSRLGDDGRVLVRPSGTEPLVRVMVEAATDDEATAVAAELARIVRDRWA